MDKIDFMLRRFCSGRRFLLKGVDYPNFSANLQRIDHPKRITLMLQRQFHHARPKAHERLGNVRHATLSEDRQRTGKLDLGADGKLGEVLPGSLYPAYGT